MTAPGTQALVYSMSISSKIEVAMVLPLPVIPGSGEDAVTFIDLSKHHTMFQELEALFDDPELTNGMYRGGPPQAKHTLVVHDVGAFIASYVPTPADFERLDKRFRMPKVLFTAVPQYASYGFAVFQLKPGNHTIQPMAFTFPTREARLFFPTVHLHDGKWRNTATFDHVLYFQHGSETGDQLSSLRPSKSYDGTVDPAEKVAKRTIAGIRANADTWIGATPS